MKEAPFKFRFVEVRGTRYLRLDDVATFLRELGGGEETDVRNRLNEAAHRITQGQPITGRAPKKRSPRDNAAQRIAGKVSP